MISLNFSFMHYMSYNVSHGLIWGRDIRVLLPQHHPTNHIQTQSKQVQFKLNGVSRRIVYLFKQPIPFFPSDILVRIKSLGTEKLQQPYLPSLTPVRPILRPSYVGIIISHVLSNRGFGAVHEVKIMGFEEKLSHLDGGSNNHGE